MSTPGSDHGHPDAPGDVSPAPASPPTPVAAGVELHYRCALPAEASTVADLVNSAYRGALARLGWTTEADLLDGQRTDADEVGGLIGREGVCFLLAEDEWGVVGSVLLQRGSDGQAQLGMFVVQPGWQGLGIGKRLMEAAERLVREAWGCDRLSLTVISRRRELIAFYERRGYRSTGEVMPFPASPRGGVPRVAGLALLRMEKRWPA